MKGNEKKLLSIDELSELYEMLRNTDVDTKKKQHLIDLSKKNPSDLSKIEKMAVCYFKIEEEKSEDPER